MSISSFKFVSPGVFVNEVDNSQLPRLPDQMGPVIIGRAERGPAMVPVRVDSFAEFVETFGAPVAGGQGDDVWRQGNKLGPTYGAYAAQAYLKNGSPITFVRLLGDQSPDADPIEGAAGWEAVGAYGLFVGAGAADKLAAVIYAQSDSNCPIKIDGNIQNSKIPLLFDNPGQSTPGTRASGAIEFHETNRVQNSDSVTINKAVQNMSNGQHEDLHIVFVDEAPANVFEYNTDETRFEVKIDLTGIHTEASDPADDLVNAEGDSINFAELNRRIKDALNAAHGTVKKLAAPEAGADDADVAAYAAAASFTIIVTGVTNPFDVKRIVINRDIVGVTTNFLSLTGGDDGTPAMAIEVTEGKNAAASGSSSFRKTISFDRTDKSSFIREVLNTNPTLTNASITSNEALENYYLGASFEQALEAHIPADQQIDAAEIRRIGEYKSYRKKATPPQTPWVLSQFMGAVELNMENPTASDLSQLFKFHSLYSGEWEQKNFKISIADIKGPTSEYLRYGSFSVLVRDAADTDASPVIYERFTNVNLDPSSPRFIAMAIGDTKMVWRDGEKRYVQVGEYANQSRFIRVEVAPDVISGAMNPELLPFGFAVPGHNSNLDDYIINQAGNNYDDNTAAPLTADNMPSFYLRQDTVSDARLSSAKAAYFGVSTDRPDTLGRYDESYSDVVRPLYGTEDMFEASTVLFTLDNVGIDPVSPQHAIYVDGGLSSGEAINSEQPGEEDPIQSSGYTRVLEAGYDKFTMPLCGGTDGLDVHQIEPFCDDVTNGKSSQNSYAYYSLSKAIDSVSDPEVVETDIMVMPGFANPGLTGKLVSVCEQRADALAIIDLENDYKPRGWDRNDEESRLPNVDKAISSLRNRGINSSYGCSFFPWVQVRDDINNRLLWMPPSVVALGTMSSSAANSELWFAPAGFTRGGLSQGAGGVPVTQTRLRLSSRERDALYEANINPIAQFPAEGIVVFGQKTLQATPSALDRINVRRLMIYVKKEISRMAATVLFDQNLEVTWARFTAQARPFLESIQARFGLTEFRVILDETTTTPELVDRNIVYAKIFLKPARAIEYIAIDFVITNTGASFDD